MNGSYLAGGNLRESPNMGSMMLAGGDSKFDQIKGNSRILHIETEVEKLKLDVMAQKENDNMRSDEMEQFFKKASLEYFSKLKDTSEKLDKMRSD